MHERSWFVEPAPPSAKSAFAKPLAAAAVVAIKIRHIIIVDIVSIRS